MTDPLTAGLAIGAIVGGGSALLGGKKDSAPTAAPVADTAPPVDQSQPAIAPGSKPAQKNSQQQSFLSGAAALQSAGRAGVGGNTGSSGGKSLLGQ